MHFRSTRSDRSKVVDLTEQEIQIASLFGLDPIVHTDDYHYKVNIPEKYCKNDELMRDVLHLIGCDDDENKNIRKSLTCSHDRSFAVHHNAAFDSLNGVSLMEDIHISLETQSERPAHKPLLTKMCCLFTCSSNVSNNQ